MYLNVINIIQYDIHGKKQFDIRMLLNAFQNYVSVKKAAEIVWGKIYLFIS